MHAKSVICSFLMIVPGVLFAVESSINSGVEFYDAGDEQEAHRIWSELSEAGDATAQFYMSILYGDGQGKIEQHDTALKWLHLAAESGSLQAQFNLGHHYIQGRWINKDAKQAAYWWARAAEDEWADAQFNLATLYLRGTGVEPDFEKSRYWYQKAAANGSAPARKVLIQLFDSRYDEESQVAISKEQPPVSVVESKQIIPVPEPTPPVSTLMDKQWVMEQPGDYLTVQLFSSANDKDCIQSSQDLNARGIKNTAVFPYQKRNRTFCAVLMGSFSDSVKTKLAVSQLPADVLAGKPFNRLFKTLQKMAR